MCGCQAHHELVDCTCSCDHGGDRMRQWQARAEAAESALAAVEQERDRAAALTLQRHETSLVREARGEAMAEVEHWRALAERAWDEAVASAYLHETESWTGIKHADNPYRAALATPTTPEETQP